MGDQFDASYWEERYRSGGQEEVGPSPHLVSGVTGLEPGRALEAGCGEGGNAIWLAEQGWQVTAVDISPTALTRARQHAARLGGAADRIDWVEADLTDHRLEPDSFDLVTCHYVHPREGHRELLTRLAAAVAPGGTLVVVDHDAADEHAHAHTSLDGLVTALEPAAWDVEVQEPRAREVVAHGRRISLRDNVLVARKRS